MEIAAEHLSSHQAKRSVVLAPWDPENEQHVSRLFQQRIACGWKYDAVEKWRRQQRDGKKNIQWVVGSESNLLTLKQRYCSILDPSNPSSAERLQIHNSAFPEQSIPLEDTSLTINGVKRQPPPLPYQFQPIGHIALDSDAEDPDLADPAHGVYGISILYISVALQRGGFGRAAMEALERMAALPPFSAKILALDTIDKDTPNIAEIHASHGKEMPKVGQGLIHERDTLSDEEGKRNCLMGTMLTDGQISNQEWYEQQGYVVFRREKHVASWSVVPDKTGKIWPEQVVFLRKHLAKAED